MARVCPLFSGSSGNSTLIKDGENEFLIDAGVSFKRLSAAIDAVGGNLQNICGVAVTHEHTDHIMGLSTLLKKLNIPVIASEKTLDTLAKRDILPAGCRCIAIEDELSFDAFNIHRFPTSHDCEGSSGYSLLLPSGKKVTVCTDLGVVTDEVRVSLKKSDCVLFESNHDIEMLKRGPYPPQTKLRILSDNGHLSNNACAAELPDLLSSGTTRFILGHISMHNNLPMLAISSAKATLSDIGAERDRDYILTAAKPQNNEVTVI